MLVKMRLPVLPSLIAARSGVLIGTSQVFEENCYKVPGPLAQLLEGSRDLLRLGIVD